MACTDSTVGDSSILPSTSSFSNLSAIESLVNVFFAHSFTSAIDHSVKQKNEMSLYLKHNTKLPYENKKLEETKTMA